MIGRKSSTRLIRWILSILLVVTGLSVTWAWGQVARLAEPQPLETESLPSPLYAAWRPSDAEEAVLFRRTDGEASWQPLALPQGAPPIAWASDGGSRLAVVLDDGSLIRSEDQGNSWLAEVDGLDILSLVWGEAGELYVGTDGQGIYRQTADGIPAAIAETQDELAQDPVRGLGFAGQRLFAATPTTLFYTDDGGDTWVKSLPLPGGISTLAVIDPNTVLVGTETLGVYRSTDAGQSWQPALEGLGLAAGQSVQITALLADPAEPGVLYAAVGYLLGATQVHFSAEGVFATLDGGVSWQRLNGPAFPEASLASTLVVEAEKSLYIQAVTADGLQSYEPDVAAALAALEGDDAQTRATAARVLGLARVQGAGGALLAALSDPEPVVSLAAADALGRIADPATASGLLVALEHPDEQIRLGAARALGMMGVEAAVEPLRGMLMNGEGLDVTVAADALGRIGSPAAGDALLTALADRGVTSRRHAALAALETMGERAVGPVGEMLESRDAYARRNAAQALGWIGSPSATPALLATLRDKNAAVRQQAAWSLGEIGDPAARAALERVQERDDSSAVQSAAAAALTRIEEQPTTMSHWSSALASALDRLQAVRWSILAAFLLGAAWLAMGNARLSPALIVHRVMRPQ